jgi:hypothetical protein
MTNNVLDAPSCDISIDAQQFKCSIKLRNEIWFLMYDFKEFTRFDDNILSSCMQSAHMIDHYKYMNCITIVLIFFMELYSIWKV